MKDNKAFTGLIAYAVNSIAMLLITGTASGLSSGVGIPIAEEGFKYLPLLAFWKRLNTKVYVVVTALMWTFVETAAQFTNIMNSQHWYIVLFLRLIPHLIFGGIFYWTQKWNKGLAFMLAIIAHIIWNTIMLHLVIV